MNRSTSEKILREVLSLPTAPFAESHVIAYVQRFVENRAHLKLREDRVGNLLVHYRRGAKRVPRPVCLTAHMDHPGFIAERMTAGGRVRAVWRGGVQPSYFKGSGVRFYSEGAWVRGRVRSTTTVRRGARTVVQSARIDVAKDVAPQSPGMWDFPDPVIREGRVRARAIDDLGGAAAMLACMHHIDANKPVGEAYFLFTRAEEVGFVGAMAACRLGTIPKRCVVVAIETSSELPNARIGNGPILRVGDKATTFTSAATAYAGKVAADLAGRNKRFVYQRRLMDGGTCESSAYCALGYDATGICLALGNYHNMNKRTGRLGAEYIGLDDYHNLVTWFVSLVCTSHRYTGSDAALDATLKRIQREYNGLLRQTAG